MDRCKLSLTITLIAILVFNLFGCGIYNSSNDTIDDYSIVDIHSIPDDVKKVCEDNIYAPCRILYKYDNDTYIIISYGQMDRPGYTVLVNSVILTDDYADVDSTLVGPKTATTTKSYNENNDLLAYVIIKISSPHSRFARESCCEP